MEKCSTNSCKRIPAPDRKRCQYCINRANEKVRRHKAQGLCRDCDRPVISGSAFCSVCKERIHSYNKENKLKQEAYRRNRRGKLISEGLCVRCNKRPPVAGAHYCVPCRQRQNASATKVNAECKRIIYGFYGNACTCCGEMEPLFLSINHINNNGNQARQEDKTGGTNFYRLLARKIQRNEAPTDLQILCHNCNWGKHINGGICPHAAEIHKAVPLFQELTH